MIGLDTNILIRYLTQDDETQSVIATGIIEDDISEADPGFITLISIIEIAWVLSSCYGVTRPKLCEGLRQLFETKQFLIEKVDTCYLALKVFEQGNGDFADAVISVLSKDAGCSKIMTFDKKAKSVGMTLAV